MTYLTFHLLFLLPPIVGLGLTLPRRPAETGRHRSRWAIPLICLIAFVYTTPWDNYLVYRGVWGYGTARVLAVIGYVPVEEYLFFILQPVLTGLVLYHLLARRTPPEHRSTERPPGRVRLAGVLAYSALTGLGAGLLLSGWARGLYLGLILTWAAPVLAGLWAYGGGLLWQFRRPFLAGVLLPTVYLWMADRAALALGIWHISDAYSLGIDPLGLPLEEAVFFLMTNLLVVQGLLLFLYGPRVAAPAVSSAAPPRRPGP